MKIVNRGETFNNGVKVAESEYVNPIAAEQLAEDVATLAELLLIYAGKQMLPRHLDILAAIIDRWDCE